jgi:hypothetical protein
MVGRAKRSGRDDCLAVERSHDAMNFCSFECLGQGQVGKYGRQSFRQQRLARSRWADENHIVPAGGGDFQGALDMLLAFHLVKIGIVLGMLVEEIGDIHRGRLNALRAV